MAVAHDPARIDVLLPADVAKTLREVIPTRKRARFIAEAVERELRRVQLEAALDASAGAWQDADHPELSDGPAIDRWIIEGRSQWDWGRHEVDSCLTDWRYHPGRTKGSDRSLSAARRRRVGHH